MSKMEFPPHDDPIDPHWWAPLEAVAERAITEPRHRFFSIDDFMLMYKSVRSRRPDVIAYKHYFTRRYLFLDEALQAYRYVAPRDPANGDGRYLKLPDLGVALHALGLWELPWMKPGLEEFRFGLSTDERWLLRPSHPRFGAEEVSDRGHLHLV